MKGEKVPKRLTYRAIALLDAAAECQDTRRHALPPIIMLVLLACWTGCVGSRHVPKAITSSPPRCSAAQTHDGDLLIRTDAELSAVDSICRVRGSVLIVGTRASEIVFRALQQVDGHIKLAGNEQATSVFAPVLRQVSGGLCLTGMDPRDQLPGYSDLDCVGPHSHLASVKFPGLESVGYGLNISHLPALRSVSFPGLQRVGGLLFVAYNDGLTSFAAPKLSQVGGLKVDGNALSGLSLPTVSHCRGGLDIGREDAMRHLTFPRLERVGGDVEFWRLPSLKTVDVSRLELVGKKFRLWKLPVLAELRAGALVRVGADMTVSEASAVEALDLARLVEIGGQLDLFLNTALKQLALTKLSRVRGNLRIRENSALKLLDLASLESVGEEFRIEGSQHLQLCELEAIAERLGRECRCTGLGVSSWCD